jgi:broad specificity phosphatase PhoE
VYSSAADRAHETAVILAAPHRLEVRRDARLREVDLAGDGERVVVVTSGGPVPAVEAHVRGDGRLRRDGS